jgi:hypothetical protein
LQRGVATRSTPSMSLDQLQAWSAAVSSGAIAITPIVSYQNTPSFLDIGCIVFCMEIKKNILRATYMGFGKITPELLM